MIIVIVDDNAQVRQVIRRVVGALDPEIHECATASEALVAVESHHPDWVLMDIWLDGADGLSATRAITTRWPEAKVCIVTNDDDEELRLAARQAGACAYVGKQNLVSLPEILAAAESAEGDG